MKQSRFCSGMMYALCWSHKLSEISRLWIDRNVLENTARMNRRARRVCFPSWQYARVLNFHFEKILQPRNSNWGGHWTSVHCEDGTVCLSIKKKRNQWQILHENDKTKIWVPGRKSLVSAWPQRGKPQGSGTEVDGQFWSSSICTCLGIPLLRNWQLVPDNIFCFRVAPDVTPQSTWAEQSCSWSFPSSVKG